MTTHHLPARVSALTLLGCLLAQSPLANTFTNVPIPGLGTDNNSSVAWGDYDNDGWLDFLILGVSGGSNVQLWRNTGSGFQNVSPPGLPLIVYGTSTAVAWGDYDNDGWLDFLLTGSTNASIGGPISQLWRNTGSGFSNVTASVAPGVFPADGGAVAWGDFDNDGRLDFMQTGQDFYSGNPRSDLWRNTGSTFANATPFGMQGAVYGGGLVWDDFDTNGWLDLLLTGLADYDYGTNKSELWWNGGGTLGLLSPAVAPGLTRVRFSSAAWGDYNNDGRPDFVIAGDIFGSSGTGMELRRNTGSAFTDVTVSVGLPHTTTPISGGTAWGDYDNDGWLDLLTGNPSRLWRNTGSGFSDVTTTVVPGLPNDSSYGSAAWADYDNDGRLDFLITGSGVGGSKLWRNTLSVTNAPPSVPTNLVVSYASPYIRVTWNAATDDHTPSAALTYNLRVGTTPGGIDVLSPMSLANGRRLVAQRGNARQRLFALLAPRLNQTLYFSVQAVDANFAGSPFSAEQTFRVGSSATLGDGDGDGVVSQGEFNTVISNYWQTSPPMIESVSAPSNTVFQFGLTNLSSLNFNVLATTNVALPLNQWQNIGPATLHYQFTDPDATNYPMRFYQLVWP